MLKTPQQPVSQNASRGWWLLYGAFAASTVVHLAAMLACAWIMMQGAVGVPLADVEARCEPSETVRLQTIPFDLKSRDRSLDSEPGSSPSTALYIKDRPVEFHRVSEPVLPVPVTRDFTANSELISGLAEKVDVSNAAGNNGVGQGTGAGAGNGGGGSAGKGFFGLEHGAKSVVFVVDCSGSMNKKHLSKWKTRFRRLKFEILKCVGGMTSDQQFYIIFFSDKTYRMPASTMQPATSQAKQKYLAWMAKQQAIGDTDPRTALRYALLLQPEMICFLTDGAFVVPIRRELTRLRQSRTKIHTFVFGNKSGESIMKTIARQNGGVYHFIP